MCYSASLNTHLNLCPFRLDQILGKQGSKAKDVYASKISLASRVVKVERQVRRRSLITTTYYLKSLIVPPPVFHQVEDIECKLDNFIELYKQDRKRFLTLPLLPDNSHSNNPNLPPLPPNSGAPGASAMATGSAGATAGSSGSLRVSLIGRVHCHAYNT